MPKPLSVDAATADLTNLLTAIRNPAPAIPLAGIDTEKLSALENLTTVFQTTYEPNHDQYTDEPFPIPVRPVPAKIMRVVTPPEKDLGTPYSDMTRDPGQRRRQQAAKQKIRNFQTPEIATNPILLRSGVTKRAALTKQFNQLVNHVLSPLSPTIIGNTDHYTVPPLNTQQPTPYAPADIMHVSIPIANAVLHPVTGSAQTFRELINYTATQKKWNQDNTNEVARLAQGLKIRRSKPPTQYFSYRVVIFPKGANPLT